MEELEDKVCPFSMGKLYEVRKCQGDKCMAWGEVQTGNGKGCRLIP